MQTQLQGIESIFKVVQIVNHRNKFITRLHSCITLLFSQISGQELAALLKMNLLIGIFQVFGVQFQLATVRAVILKNTFFFQNTFNGCISCFFCSMIQKIIRELTKLEAAYFLHVRCYYLHIYSQLGTIKTSEIKFKHIVLYRLAN